jgi:hypothetical protein
MVEIYIKDGVVIRSFDPKYNTRVQDKKKKTEGKWWETDTTWADALKQYAKYSSSSKLYEKYKEMQDVAVQASREQAVQRAPRFVNVRPPDFYDRPYASSITATSTEGSPASNSIASDIGQALRASQAAVDHGTNAILGGIASNSITAPF